MAGLLDGMRVLDLSAWRPMPHATQILADLGAEVLKVEPPGGDPMRGYPEIFASVARGKRSIVLDLRSDDGHARALELAAEADVVCESWRPGVAERLGLGVDAVQAVNPTVIYCSLSGFGQNGPLRDVPGHDVNFQAVAGALAPRAPDEVPEVGRLPVADLEGGTVAAVLICAAWARRLATGVGERIDVAMADVVAWWVGTRSGVVHEDADGPTGGSPGYGLFRTADGRYVALGVLAEARLWQAVCAALGLEDLAELTFAERLARTVEVNERIAEQIATLGEATALARLMGAGAPVTPVLSPEEATVHPQLRARELHVQTEQALVARLPGRLLGGGLVPAADVPAPGAHPEGFSARSEQSGGHGSG
jgi:crotonobetainyl-CoA:carnitine CoA-transferase CaiB-like acyl-CoA transferase